MVFTVRTKWLMVWGLMALIILGFFDGPLLELVKYDAYPGQQIARIGFWMGHGLVLGLPLALLAGIGYWLKKTDWQWLGIQGLAALGLSSAWVRVLKHVVGRPRPRLWLEGITHFGPTYAHGMDSFPSGHTAISMAVAFVLSYHYPKASPLFMGAAALVAASRMMGGSHFPTDVVGGMILGLMTGWLVLYFTWPYKRLAEHKRPS